MNKLEQALEDMKTETRETYQGWANRETWNIALFINNDWVAYEQARGFMVDYKGRTPFQDFTNAYGYISTSDGVLFNDPKLSKRELNFMMRDLL